MTWMDRPLESVETAGAVILAVPPVAPIPDGSVLPAHPCMIGVKDTKTGQLHCGVIRVLIESVIDDRRPEIVAWITELRRENGSPAVTDAQVRGLMERLTPEELDDWPTKAPKVASLYRVDGFEAGAAPMLRVPPEAFEGMFENENGDDDEHG